ncbi:hypothetical protein CAC42_771 [Sphaceloma murrayae]|uniref:Myb-like DNA-binding domain-containing protein n=1 Tax=Sphaceloma murrayae TaxID=2082308 RepID=A0A2K1QKR2_9PEZI|nr:hypothetical protein CAC42_771 [Sphaceloma murrayae]
MSDKGFSAGEQKLLMVILSNLKGDINADWAAVAKECNYKDAGIARTRWTQIKRKKIHPGNGSGSGKDKGATETNGDSDGEGDSVATPKKSSPKKRGRKATGEGGDEAETGAEELGLGDAETKPKGKRGRPAKKPKVDVKVDPEDEAVIDEQ